MERSTVVRETRDLLAISRPWSWATTALPFAVAAFDAARGLSPAILLGTLYFLLPYQLLIHALDPGPGDSPERTRIRQIAVGATNLPLLAALVLLGGAVAGIALVGAVLVALAVNAPPIRARSRPIGEPITGALQVVLAAVCGCLIGGRAVADLPWLLLATFTLWAVAAFALRSIVGVGTERPAGDASIAVTLGTRVTALVALVGFFVAAAVVASLGPLGALAALALDAFLLLPAMILTADRQDPAGEASAAGRAWAAFPGLAVLVGTWLGYLLLRHWGIVTVDPLVLAIIVASVLAGWVLLDIVLTRLVTHRRRVPETDWDAEIPSLTIVVSSRDAGGWFADMIAALRDQTYADATIIVVDDGAIEGSAEFATELVGYDGRVVIAPPVPEGRARDGWLRQVGAEAATTDLVLFLDPDTYLMPVALRKLVEQQQRGGYELLSGVTSDAMPTRSEVVAVPGFALVRFGFVPIWVSALTRGRPAGIAFASDRLLLVRRDAYTDVGGHAAAPASERDAIALARTFVRGGRRIGTIHVADLGETRRYPGTGAAIAAWRRMFLPAVGGSLALALLAVIVSVITFLVPLALPIIAFIGGAEPRMIVASFVPLGLLTAARLALTMTQRQSPLTIFVHPLTAVVMLIGQVAAIVDHISGRRHD